MPDIKLRDGSGVEQTYTGVDTITVPLADGTGTWTYGLTEEELTFTNASYMFSSDSPFYNNSNYYIRRSNFNNITNMSYMFKDNDKITDLSDITINISGDTNAPIVSTFENCINLRKLPTFTMSSGSKVNMNQSISFLRNCYVLEENELQKVIYLEPYNSPQSSLFAYNYNIKNMDLSNMKLNTWDNSYWSYNKFVNSEPNLRSLKLPAWNVKQDSKPLGSSYYLSDSFTEMIMLDSLTFSTNADGSPMKAKVKSQSFSVTGNSSHPYGCSRYDMGDYTSSKGLMLYPDEPLTGDDNVFRDITGSDTTVEKIQEGYDRVKNRPNWCSFWSGNVTYNGTSIPASRLTSRFNHTSIVEFINTIPDTSEYLAIAGGTNTIKLFKYQGDLTDEGGVSDLTPEEIAVATAKGWTVTLV